MQPKRLLDQIPERAQLNEPPTNDRLGKPPMQGHPQFAKKGFLSKPSLWWQAISL
jgi:hypothetical protein